MIFSCLRRVAPLFFCLPLTLGVGIFTSPVYVHAAPVQALGIWEEAPEPSGVAAHVDVNAPKGGTIRLAAIGSFDNFNPFSPRGRSAAYMAWTYETLGYQEVGRGSVIQGLIAKSFDLASDRSFLLVHLRPEARFCDGKAITAEDVAFSFEALCMQASPIYRNYYAQVKAATVVDTYTVRFDFTNTHNRELPLIICQMPVLPAHWWKERDMGAPQAEPMPGSGPYKPVQWKMGDNVVLERDPNWWGASLPIHAGRYNFERIHVEYYRDRAVAREAFLAGEADFFTENTIKDWKHGYDSPAVRDGRITLKDVPFSRGVGMTGIFMNTKSPVLADKRVRQALTLLFDFEWLNRSLFYGEYRRCSSFFTGLNFASKGEPSAAELAFMEQWRNRLDPAVFGPVPVMPVTDGTGNIRPQMRQALALFKAAGWEMKDGVMKNARGEAMHLLFPLGTPSMQRTLIPYQNTLKRLGIALDIQTPDQTQYINRLHSDDYDMVLATVRQSENPGNEQRSCWSSVAADQRGSKNYANVRLPVVDEIVEKLIAATSYEELTVAASVLDRVLRHENIVIPGWYGPEAHIAWWNGRVQPSPKFPPAGIDISAWSASEGNK